MIEAAPSPHLPGFVKLKQYDAGEKRPSALLKPRLFHRHRSFAQHG